MEKEIKTVNTSLADKRKILAESGIIVGAILFYVISLALVMFGIPVMVLKQVSMVGTISLLVSRGNLKKQARRMVI